MATVKDVAEALSIDRDREYSEDEARAYLAIDGESPDDFMARRAARDLKMVGINYSDAPPPPPEVEEKYTDAALPPQDAAKDLP